MLAQIPEIATISSPHQQFRNLGLAGVTPEEKCPESTGVCRSSFKERLTGHFPRGITSLELSEAGGILGQTKVGIDTENCLLGRICGWFLLRMQ
jgi:hypothetical protein